MGRVRRRGSTTVIITQRAYPRAALIGSPSDGYFGKTIAFTFRNFCAEVRLFETPEFEIQAGERDRSRYGNVEEMIAQINRFGYYGGVRLLQAAVKRFHDHCRQHAIPLEPRGFTLRYTTSIPPHLGLAGSSAIITACFRALLEFFGVTVEKPVLANLILESETRELGIPAGLQDRVAQVYDCPMFMDFDRQLIETRGYGNYLPLPPHTLPRLYVAYRTELAEGSEVLHSNLRYRYNQGDKDVLDAIREWADLTVRARDLLLAGRGAELGPLLNRNFDLRRQVCQLSAGNIEMVETARAAGASAKFTGSGGAIIGTYTDEAVFEALAAGLGRIGVHAVKPVL